MEKYPQPTQISQTASKVEEKFTDIDRIKENYKAQEDAAKKSENYKADLEHQRYKQDARKRALDLAHATARDMGEWLEKNSLEVLQIGDEKKPKVIPSKLVAAEILIPIADKYYNWLISISEK